MSDTKDYSKIMEDLLAGAREEDYSELSEAALRLACSILFVAVVECGPENRTNAMEFLVDSFRKRLQNFSVWEQTIFHTEGSA